MKSLAKAVLHHLHMCIGAFIIAPLLCLGTYFAIGDKMVSGGWFFLPCVIVYCGCIGTLFDYSDIDNR